MNLAHNFRLGSREAERWQIKATVDSRDGNRRQRASISDISVSGLRLRTLDPLRVAQTFWVKLPMIEPRQINVQWVDGFIAGCAFTEPLSEYVLAHILKTAQET